MFFVESLILRYVNRGFIFEIFLPFWSTVLVNFCIPFLVWKSLTSLYFWKILYPHLMASNKIFSLLSSAVMILMLASCAFLLRVMYECITFWSIGGKKLDKNGKHSRKKQVSCFLQCETSGKKIVHNRKKINFYFVILLIYVSCLNYSTGFIFSKCVAL